MIVVGKGASVLYASTNTLYTSTNALYASANTVYESTILLISTRALRR